MRTVRHTATPTRRARRVRALITASAIVAALTGCATPAQAASSHRENDLRGYCTATRTVECVVTANDDDGVVFRDRAGKRHHPASPASALRYLRHHAIPCKEEDSPRCYWDAGHRGNDVGQSFMVTGGKREGEGSVFYLYLA